MNSIRYENYPIVQNRLGSMAQGARDHGAKLDRLQQVTNTGNVGSYLSGIAHSIRGVRSPDRNRSIPWINRRRHDGWIERSGLPNHREQIIRSHDHEIMRSLDHMITIANANAGSLDSVFRDRDRIQGLGFYLIVFTMHDEGY